MACEERLEVGALHPLLGGGPPGPGVGEQDGEVDLVLVGVEVEEQLLHLVDHLVDAGVGPVHLVDHQHHREPGLEGLAQHEPGLGQGPLRGVHQQEDAVDHGQAPLDLPAEVGVARGVDDVDLDPVVEDGRVLGQDGDALLPLEVARVHDPLVDRLVVPERPRLPEHGVDQGGLAVVDVGHDGHVADVVSGLNRHKRRGYPPEEPHRPSEVGNGGRWSNAADWAWPPDGQEADVQVVEPLIGYTGWVMLGVACAGGMGGQVPV